MGYLYAAAAVGAVLATDVSGRLGEVRRQGLAIMVSIVGWGFGIIGLGVALLGAERRLTRPRRCGARWSRWRSPGRRMP